MEKISAFDKYLWLKEQYNNEIYKLRPVVKKRLLCLNEERPYLKTHFSEADKSLN